MVLVKNLKSCRLQLCGKIGQAYAFRDILERKKAFFGYKKKMLKKTKN